ncbi:type VI secretion system baseplate subunit TssG [Labrenzia sp. PHM005]|uniref:type VI secretion system baseplate subunit TssG n=1 Tax=Labrenzia sp. PHM005 TaxID=2590016 RepID=UPI00143D7D9E|nr:type VI secretion system baseplate subunit TssG [Labrenzia sp. PHM005]
MTDAGNKSAPTPDTDRKPQPAADKTVIRPGGFSQETWEPANGLAQPSEEDLSERIEDTDTTLSDATKSSETEADQEKANAKPEKTEDLTPETEPEQVGDPEIPEEPIEPAPPVQQQYASLLNALETRLQDHPGGHDFLAVLRMLEGQTAQPSTANEGSKKTDPGTPPRIGKSRRLNEDIVRFGQDPSSEFSPSTIERVQRDVKGGLVLMERFLGLLGPHGALPAPLTDEAIMRGLRGEDSFPRFLDVFNGRFIQLFFRAWADARPIVQHDRPDDDRFLAYIGSTIGIGTPLYRDQDTLDDRLKLHYAGLMAPKVKSAARLKALVSGTFGVRVEIEQCVGTWLHLDPDDQLALGGFGPGGAGSLGRDTIVGAKIYSVSDKIRIRIYTEDLDQYRKFLPPTRTKPNPFTEKLFDLIDFYLGLELEYEIELALPKRCASAVRMDKSGSATLGHIGWLKPAAPEAPTDKDMEDDELLTDTRFRPVRRHTAVYQ